MSTKMSQMIVDKKELQRLLTEAEEQINNKKKEISKLKASNDQNSGQTSFWQKEVEEKQAIINDQKETI